MSTQELSPIRDHSMIKTISNVSKRYFTRVYNHTLKSVVIFNFKIFSVSNFDTIEKLLVPENQGLKSLAHIIWIDQSQYKFEYPITHSSIVIGQFK